MVAPSEDSSSKVEKFVAMNFWGTERSMRGDEPRAHPLSEPEMPPVLHKALQLLQLRAMSTQVVGECVLTSKEN